MPETGQEDLPSAYRYCPMSLQKSLGCCVVVQYVSIHTCEPGSSDQKWTLVWGYAHFTHDRSKANLRIAGEQRDCYAEGQKERGESSATKSCVTLR